MATATAAFDTVDTERRRLEQGTTDGIARHTSAMNDVHEAFERVQAEVGAWFDGLANSENGS